MNEIERAYHEATEQWRAGFRAGVEAAAKKCDAKWEKLKGIGGSANTFGAGAVRGGAGAGFELAQSIRSLLNESVDAEPPDQYNRQADQETQP